MDFGKYTYFRCSEFDSPDAPGSGAMMNEKLIDKLVIIRNFVGGAILINSGFRTKEHNAKVGGVPDSEHLDGDAADIACRGSAARMVLVRAALASGIRRIGIGTSFVHVGISERLPQDVIWVY